MRTPHLNASWPKCPTILPNTTFIAAASALSLRLHHDLSCHEASRPRSQEEKIPKIPASPSPGWELRTGSPAVYPQSRSCSFLRMELKYMGVEEGSMKPRRTDTVSLVPDRHQHAGCPSSIPHPAFRGSQMEFPEKTTLQDSGPHYYRVTAGLMGHYPK